MGERYPGNYDPASMSPPSDPSEAAPGPCPLCGQPLYGWIALPDVGAAATIGAPLSERERERVIDRCENCGVALERGLEIDLAAEWEAVCQVGEAGGREISLPNRAGLQAWIGEVGWAGIDRFPGRLMLTRESVSLLAGANGHTLERLRTPITRRAQAWMWQTLLNGLTFHPNFAREVRAGRLRPANSRGRASFAIDAVVTVLGAPLVLLLSVPLELGAAIAGRGGVLAGTARREGAAANGSGE
jgi:hypothetical protein